MSTPTGPAVKNTRSTVPFRVAVLLARYTVVRAETDRLCETLEPDDYQLQSLQQQQATAPMASKAPIA